MAGIIYQSEDGLEEVYPDLGESVSLYTLSINVSPTTVSAVGDTVNVTVEATFIGTNEGIGAISVNDLTLKVYAGEDPLDTGSHVLTGTGFDLIVGSAVNVGNGRWTKKYSYDGTIVIPEEGENKVYGYVEFNPSIATLNYIEAQTSSYKTVTAPTTSSTTTTYSITYHFNDSDDSLLDYFDNISLGDTQSESVTAGSSTTLLTKAEVDEYTGVHSNITFKGWATSDGGSVVYAGGATFTPTADTDLYAVWEEVADSITLTVNGKDYTNGIIYGLDNGYSLNITVNTASGTWSVTASDPNKLYINNSGTTCQIKFKEIGYTRLTFTSGTASCYVDVYNRVTVTFDTDGGEAISDIVSYDTFTAPDTTRTTPLSSKVFSFFMNDGTSSIVQSTTVTRNKIDNLFYWECLDDDTVEYAEFYAGQTYPLTKNLNLTAYYDDELSTIEYDPTTITVPANPTREGYLFTGWATSASGTVDSSITAGSSIEATATATYYYAQWEEVVLKQAEICLNHIWYGNIRNGQSFIFNNSRGKTSFSYTLKYEKENIPSIVSFSFSNQDVVDNEYITTNQQGFRINPATPAYSTTVTVTAVADGYEVTPLTFTLNIDNSNVDDWNLIRDKNFDFSTLLPNSYWEFINEVTIENEELPLFMQLYVRFIANGIVSVSQRFPIYIFYVPESYNIPLGEIGWGEASYTDDPLILAQEPENNRFYLLSLPSGVTGGDTTADVTVKIISENFEGEVKMNLERD